MREPSEPPPTQTKYRYTTYIYSVTLSVSCLLLRLCGWLLQYIVRFCVDTPSEATQRRVQIPPPPLPIPIPLGGQRAQRRRPRHCPHVDCPDTLLRSAEHNEKERIKTQGGGHKRKKDVQHTQGLLRCCSVSGPVLNGWSGRCGASKELCDAAMFDSHQEISGTQRRPAASLTAGVKSLPPCRRQNISNLVYLHKKVAFVTKQTHFPPRAE